MPRFNCLSCKSYNEINREYKGILNVYYLETGKTDKNCRYNSVSLNQQRINKDRTLFQPVCPSNYGLNQHKRELAVYVRTNVYGTLYC